MDLASIEIGDIVTGTRRNQTRYEVMGKYIEGNQLWLRPTTGKQALSYTATDFVKVEPFFEAGKTYTRGGGGEHSRTNVFACTAAETSTDGTRVAFGRYYDDERVESYVWVTLVSFRGWKERS